MSGTVLAVATGAAAAFNPCGVGLLPSYVAYLLGRPQADRPGAAAREGLAVGGAMACGALALYTLLGTTFGLAAGALGPHLRAVGVAVGVALGVWGIAILLWPDRFAVSVPLRKTALGRGARGLAGAVLYGVAFALASLGCAFPLFASLLFQAAASGAPAAGLATVLAYGAGMAAVLMALAVSARLARSGLTAWLGRVRAPAARLTGAVVLLSGAYVAAYWTGLPRL